MMFFLFFYIRELGIKDWTFDLLHYNAAHFISEINGVFYPLLELFLGVNHVLSSYSDIIHSCLFQISQFSKNIVCFVMFLDEQTLSKVSLEGHVPDDKGYIGLWRIVVVKNLPYDDMRRTGKVPKFLSHRLFPSSRWLLCYHLV